MLFRHQSHVVRIIRPLTRLVERMLGARLLIDVQNYFICVNFHVPTLFNLFSPIFFLTVAKMSLPKVSAPHWSITHPFQFFLTFRHSGAQSKDTVVSVIRYAISKVFPWIPSADNWITHRENVVTDPNRAIGMALLEAEMMHAKGPGFYGVQAGNCKCLQPLCAASAFMYM